MYSRLPCDAVAEVNLELLVFPCAGMTSVCGHVFLCLFVFLCLRFTLHFVSAREREHACAHRACGGQKRVRVLWSWSSRWL